VCREDERYPTCSVVGGLVSNRDLPAARRALTVADSGPLGWDPRVSEVSQTQPRESVVGGASVEVRVIEVRDLSKRHGDERAADRRTFTVEPGAIRALP